jgi:pimeloyl-ACP methyl ester carboxylesterase
MNNFNVIEHTILSSYVREYAFATVRDQDDELLLHVKQYVPYKHDDHQTNQVTIIACGALGFPKEIYEPLWEELWQRSRSRNFSIHSIWTMDPVNIGISATLNEGKLGDDPSWIDHTRDLFLLINKFRKQMPRPLMGIGHSFGGVLMIDLALFHPRLFSSLILLDPYLTRIPPANFRGSLVFHKFLVSRRENWPSRSSAEADIAKWPLYHGFDSRCLAALLKYGLRTLSASGNTLDPPVTWATPAAQEIHLMGRPTRAQKQTDGTYVVDRAACPDLDTLDACDSIYRWETRVTWDRIVELRPSVKFVLGANSYVPRDEVRTCISRCGTG